MEPALLSDWRPRGRYAALEPALLSDWRPRGGYTALEPALLSDWKPRGRYSLWLDFLSDVCKPVGFELLSRGRQFESAFFPALEPKGGVHSFCSAWRHQGGGTRSQKNFIFQILIFFAKKSDRPNFLLKAGEIRFVAVHIPFPSCFYQRTGPSKVQKMNSL